LPSNPTAGKRRALGRRRQLGVGDGRIHENCGLMDIIHIMLQMEVDVFARLRYLQGAPMTDLPRRQFDRQAVRRSGGQLVRRSG